MDVKKVKMRKIKDYILYPGDLLFYKKRNTELTIIGCDTIFGGYKVIFHDTETIGNLPFECLKYCYHI